MAPGCAKGLIVANYRKRGEPGRFTKGQNALTEQLYARVTLAQLAAFARLGGAAWLRAQIDAAVAADRDLPTAHQPFPIRTRAEADALVVRARGVA